MPGIQADILAIAANGVYACSVVTALTAQNPDGVYGVLPAGAESVEAQMKAVADFYSPGAAKTGMLFDAQTVAAVAKFFRANRGIKLVVDPVAISTSGAKLLSDDAVGELKNSLIPISDVFTPNIDEAKMLLGADSIDDTTDAAEALYKKFSVPVLLKGGHLEGGTVSDVFFDGVRQSQWTPPHRGRKHPRKRLYPKRRHCGKPRKRPSACGRMPPRKRIPR